MKNNDTENNLTQTQATEARTPQQQLDLFIELRAEGLSLGKISELTGVPKTTLFDWNVRNRQTIDRLKRINLEALEERIIGSHQAQFAMLTDILKRLDACFERKLDDYEDDLYDLSPTEIFWMAANLRSQLHRFRHQAPLADIVKPHSPSEQIRTIPNENTPPPCETC